MADMNNITEHAVNVLRRKEYELDRLKEELEDAESTLDFTISSRVEEAIEEEIENIKEDIEETQKRIAKLEAIIESGVDPVINVSVEKYHTRQNGYVAVVYVTHASHDFTRYYINEETYSCIRGLLKEHHKGINKTWLLPDWDRLNIEMETFDIEKVTSIQP